MSSRTSPPRPGGSERTRRFALGYVRVSSRGRQEENCSLETQEAAIRAYCQREQLVLVDVLEEAETAIDEDLGARPVLGEARRRIRNGDADTLVIFKVDRVFRNQYQPAALLPDLRAHGAWLEFVLERFEDTPIGRFSLQAMAFAAELEHAAIKERTLRGRRDSLQTHGRLPPAPKALYGYRFVYGPNNHGDAIIVAYAEDPETAWVVRRIYRDYLAGQTLRAIATALTREGLPPPSGRANPWSYVTVRARLIDARYAGQARAWRTERRRTANGRPGWRWRPEAEQVALPDGTIPALVEAAQWAAAQDRRRTNREASARNNPDPGAALLRGGAVRCAYCRKQADPERGRTMVVANANRHRSAMYRCVAVLDDGRQCTNSILVGLLDQAAWRLVQALLAHPEQVGAHFRDLAAEDPTQGELAGIEAALRQCRREERNLAVNIAKVAGPAVDVVAAELTRKGEERASLERTRERILRDRARWTAERERIAGAEDMLRLLATQLGRAGSAGSAGIGAELAAALPMAERQELVRLLGLSVEVRRPHEPYANGRRYALATALGTLAPGAALPGACGKNGLSFLPQWPVGDPLVLRWADRPPPEAA